MMLSSPAAAMPRLPRTKRTKLPAARADLFALKFKTELIFLAN